MSKNEPLSLEVFDNPEFGQMRILREGDKYLFPVGASECDGGQRGR